MSDKHNSHRSPQSLFHMSSPRPCTPVESVSDQAVFANAILQVILLYSPPYFCLFEY